MKLSRKITSWVLALLLVMSMAVTLPASSRLNSDVKTTSVNQQASVKKELQTYSISNSSIKYYSGTYYNPIGGLDSLVARTDTNGLVQDIRALIDYSSNSATTTLGTTIKGTDKSHPSYSGTGSNSLAEWYKKSDRAENDTHAGFKLFYTQDYTTTSNWNREHVWPQSLSGGLYGKTGAGSDLHHIRPTYNKDNSTRGNTPYGNCVETTKTVYVNGASNGYVIAHVGKASNGTTVFDPNDDYKGDIARIIAYMAVHYESLYGIVTNVMVGGFKTIVEWNALDPVDDVEINRNNVAFECQGNRNPFIDCPDLINSIWNNGVEPGSPDEPVVTYSSVTYSLTNATSSNNATSVKNGSAYQAVITANAGYELKSGSVSVTMGGSDITSSSYTESTGTVYISNVTGNISVSAEATLIEEEPDPDPDPDPIDPDDIIYNYSGTYYDVLGGLEGLVTRTDSNTVLLDLRALIDYSGNKATLSNGKTISGTDAKHPSYSGTSANSLAQWYKTSERAEDDPNEGFKLFYTQDYTTTSNWNREHVWPQSQSGGLYGTSGAGADLHHIRPTYNKDNSTRGNTPYGEAVTTSKTVYVNGAGSGYVIAYIGPAENGTTVFEPNDDYKGDIARIVAYMVTHYESLYDIVENVLVGGYDTLVAWNALDPVDAVEINRNNVAFECQGNRNPFIDCPDLINTIWGSGKPVTSDKYSITYSLSNAQSSNKVSSVNKNGTYTTTITVDSGYILSSATVTMGGKDVTSTYFVYSDETATGTINIPSVTGNVVIKISTEKKYEPVYDKFAAISSAGQVRVGDKIIIAFGDEDTKPAASAVVTGSYLTTESVLTNDGIATPDAEQLTVWEVKEGSTEGTFKLYNALNEVYLAGSGNKTAVTLSKTDGANLYIGGDGLGGLIIINSDNNGRFLGSHGPYYTELKWYATQNLSDSSYYYDTTIYAKSAGVAPSEDYDYVVDGYDVIITKCNLTDSKDITVPSEINGKWVVEIGDSAFSGLVKLESVTLPNSVTDLGDNVFAGCVSLTSAKLGTQLSYMGEGVFMGCKALESISIPEYIEEIPAYTFNGCEKLSNIVMTSNVTTIGDYAFRGCDAIYKLVIPSTVTKAGTGAFMDCPELKTVRLSYNMRDLADSMFENCSSLKNIVIPATVSSIGNYTFKGCTALTDISINSKNISRSNRNINKGTNVKARANTSITIGSGAFENCVNVEYVRLPANVSSIGSNAFAGCKALSMVGVYNKSAMIGTGVFDDTAESFEVYGYNGSTVSNLGYSFSSLSTSDVSELEEQTKSVLRKRITVTGCTDKSMYALEVAYRNALEEISMGKSANQFDIDLAYEKLVDAVEGLKQRATNFEELAYNIELVELVDPTGFTEESLDEMYDLCDEAYILLADPDASQEEVDAMAQALLEAMMNLEYEHYYY
ncbi:MAG: endonuclease [Acutalibacteraceae bacterium]